MSFFREKCEPDRPQAAQGETKTPDLLRTAAGSPDTGTGPAPAPADRTDAFRESAQSLSKAETKAPGRTALVTGASRGIGRAAAGALAAEGWNLILTCSRSMDELEAAAAQLSAADRTLLIRCVRCDMGDPDQVRALFAQIPRLDLVVNNAGIAWYGLLQDMTDEEWNRILAVNLSSVFYTCRAAIPLFLRQGSGQIINISSVWGNVGASCEAAYSAAKGGVNALTKALAKELAPQGIPVNALACGCVDTAMNGHLGERERAALEEEIPAGRFADPEEVAGALLRLIGMPSYLTGQIITMDGGWC